MPYQFKKGWKLTKALESALNQSVALELGAEGIARTPPNEGAKEEAAADRLSRYFEGHEGVYTFQEACEITQRGLQEVVPDRTDIRLSEITYEISEHIQPGN